MKNKYFYIVVTPFFPSPNNWRGAYVLDQVKAIERNSNYSVIVFRPTSYRNDKKEYEVDGIKVFLFPTIQTPSYMFNGLFNEFNSRSFLKRINELDMDFNNIQFVHTHTAPLGIYALALHNVSSQIKTIVQHHDLDPFLIRNGKFARWKLNARYRAKNSLRIINAVDLNICISTPCKESLLSFPHARTAEVYESYIKALIPVSDLPKATPNNVYVLYNGVDTSVFNENINKTERNDNIFRIGCIANFQELKDHITLIKAFEILIKKGYNNMRLSLLGTGETRSMCETYIQEHGLSGYVEWPIEVTHDKLPNYYRSLSIFVLPSIFEGFGCVYTEAYACGVPFICVDGNGAAEVIVPEERNRWVMRPHDYNQLATLIEDFYNYRYEQQLCKPIDIDVLIIEYMKFIQTL